MKDTLTPKNIIAISVFVAVLILINTAIFLYREKSDLLVNNYIAKISNCGNITDENVCFDKTFCKGIYGPSCPGCTDSVMLECMKISDSEKIIIAGGKSLCARTGGEWIRTPKLEFCSCQTAGQDKKFSQTQGCVDK